MITQQQIESHLKAKPFTPFRIHMNDGNAFDVTEFPGQTLVTPAAVHVGVDPDDQSGVYDRLVRCPFDQIDRIEQLESATSRD